MGEAPDFNKVFNPQTIDHDLRYGVVDTKDLTGVVKPTLMVTLNDLCMVFPYHNFAWLVISYRARTIDAVVRCGDVSPMLTGHTDRLLPTAQALWAHYRKNEPSKGNDK